MIYNILSISAIVISLGLQCLEENPASGVLELRWISEQEEIAIGKKGFRPEALRCAFLQQYVQSIGERIAAVSDRPHLPYEFVVTDEFEPAATSYPGGKILISKGFVLSLKDEAELVAVLAHEIAHANLRHVAKEMERKSLFAAVPWFYLDLTELMELARCRNEEYEADEYGVKYMVAAGYDPQAAEDVMIRTLEEDEEEFELLSTHPQATKRRAAVRRVMERLGVGGRLRREVGKYQAMRNRFLQWERCGDSC